ncbi:MBL fold metallo-hydrolase [cf. Phormidesmis sp. LEGE 11477]|uniref:MBL fold metallo-hydrolase n=1 Tax=cf. Phormidesmis sp. LEGE 11477 TaxID=1828680 RepID=UPI001881B3ED|nr:MBL fold metallo-hydrolase [cf. Phormidesmis sp. LEGE 11477]MBE9061719.1 MBL fold metallo-hydrolase [cf. Phormidesmis sp. LEGE 11477]
MKLTWFDANTWLIEAAGKRVLIDPWFVDDLTFGDLPWLVRGIKTDPPPIPGEIDLILLSQGLADHAHPPTLKQLDKSIPVMASPDGAAVAESLGFRQVTTLTHGESAALSDGTVKVQTFIGAIVGMNKKENAYVLTFKANASSSTNGSSSNGAHTDEADSDRTLYYEPHGYPDTKHLKELGQVDVAIAPMANITLMGLAPVVRGGEVALQLAELLRPQVMLPTAEAGKVTYDGLIAGAIKAAGGVDEVRSLLAAKGLKTQVIQPVSGEAVDLTLQRTVQAGA